jgi:hypothetical protein
VTENPPDKERVAEDDRRWLPIVRRAEEAAATASWCLVPSYRGGGGVQPVQASWGSRCCLAYVAWVPRVSGADRRERRAIEGDEGEAYRWARVYLKFNLILNLTQH